MDIKDILDGHAKAWDAFKATNDDRLKAIEAKASTSDYDAKLAKINADMDSIAAQQRDMESKMARGAASQASQPDEHKQAFSKFMRRGDVSSLDGIKGMVVRDEANGGYLVPQAVVGPIVQRIFDGSPIRQIARVQAISGNAIEGVVSYGQLSVSWVDEVTASSDPTTPTLKKYRIETNTQRSSPRVSPILLEDAAVDVEMWLGDQIARDFALSEGTAFVAGSGANQPRGFATYTTAATADSTRAWGQLEHIATGTSASFGTNANGVDKLISLTGALKSGYRQGAVFVMSKGTLAAARVLKTSNGDYIWQPSTQAGNPSVLLGYSVIEAEDMPAVGASSLSIAFGNFNAGYMIVDRSGLSVLRDPYSNNPQVTFHATRRVGGGVIDFDAIKFLKFA